MNSEDFYTFSNQIIFQAVLALCDAGKPVNKFTVAIAIGQRVKGDEDEKVTLEDVGGLVFLDKLWDEAPTSFTAIECAKTVHEHFQRRELIKGCQDIQKEAEDPIGPMEIMLSKAEQVIFRITQSDLRDSTVTVQQALREELDRLDTQQKPGIQTGLLDVDVLTSGLQDSELIVLAARPGVGKSALAVNIFRHVGIHEQLPVLFCSLEQRRGEIAGRLLCLQGKVNTFSYRSRKLSGDDYDKIRAANEDFRNAPIWINDGFSLNMRQIAGRARSLKTKHGLRLVIVDYLQLIEPDIRTERANRQEQVSSFSRKLKSLARELAIPVVAIAQLNRGSEDHAKPKLSDLRESGAIEQDADMVGLLYRADPDQKSVITLDIAKQRNGPTGEVNLIWHGEYMEFCNYAPTPDGQGNFQ